MARRSIHDPQEPKTIRQRELYKRARDMVMNRVVGIDPDDLDELDLQAWELASSLTYIIDAVENHRQGEPAHERDRGRLGAVHLLSAILNGYSHDIHAFMKGARGENALNRPPKAPFADIRAFTIAAFRVLQDRFKMKERPAAKQVAEAFERAGYPLSIETIRGYSRSISRDLNKSVVVGERILQTYGSTPEDVCRCAAETMVAALDPRGAAKVGG